MAPGSLHASATCGLTGDTVEVVPTILSHRATTRRHLRDPWPRHGRARCRPSRAPGHGDGARAARPTCCSPGSCATTRPTRTGPTATASSCRTGTPRSCCTRCSTSPATASSSTTSRRSASGARARPATPRCTTPPASRSPPARSVRASPTPSAWRIAERDLRARFGADVVDHHTFVHLRRRRLQEGISHEAASLAGHLGSAASSASTTTTTSRSTAHTELAVQRRRRQALRGLRLARRAPRRDRQRPRRARSRRCAPAMAVDRPAVADRAAQPHRLPVAQVHRHREGPRQPVRRRRGQPHEGDPGHAADEPFWAPDDVVAVYRELPAERGAAECAAVGEAPGRVRDRRPSVWDACWAADRRRRLGGEAAHVRAGREDRHARRPSRRRSTPRSTCVPGLVRRRRRPHRQHRHEARRAAAAVAPSTRAAGRSTSASASTAWARS